MEIDHPPVTLIIVSLAVSALDGRFVFAVLIYVLENNLFGALNG
jgi:hypothetical protein